MPDWKVAGRRDAGCRLGARRRSGNRGRLHGREKAAPHEGQVAERLELIEAYDLLGLYAYHLTEHRGTPLAVTPSPNLMLAVLRP